LAAVQIAFAAFSCVKPGWYLRGVSDRSPRTRLVIGIGGLLVGAGWIGSGYSMTLHGLYIWYAIGGIGAGAVYGGCTGNVLKWFRIAVDFAWRCVRRLRHRHGVTVAPIDK